MAQAVQGVSAAGTMIMRFSLELTGFTKQVGSFVAPLLASRVFFANTVDNDQGLKNVQWVYLGVACFVALLVILFLLAPMPEITDADSKMSRHFWLEAYAGGMTDDCAMAVHVVESEIGETDPGPFRKQLNLFLAVSRATCP